MRLFVWFGSLLVLVLLAALVVPPFFDWNRFRTGFEQEASRVLGQPVKVRGETSARLLPLPSVTFGDVQVGDGNEPMLMAESFHVNVELAPLLKGEVVIVDMSLEKPRLDVGIAKDGTMDWSLRRQGASSRVSADDVAVENITITDGVLRVRDERFEREFIIRDIDATATASTLAGPWRGDVRLSYLGNRFNLEGSTGRLRPAGSIHLNATIKPQNRPYDIAFKGPLSVKNGIPSAVGIITVKPLLRQTDAERIRFPRQSVGDALPVRFEGDLQIGSAGASVPAFRMEVGDGEDPYTLVGSGQVVFGELLSFRAKAEGQQIDIERLKAAEHSGGESEIKDEDKDLPARLSAFAKLLNRIPRFDAKGDIDVKLPAVIAGDTVIRDITLNMRPLDAATGWRLSNVKAQLPGRTELRADGNLVLGDDPSWNGEMIVASKQPSGLAKWLAPDVDPAIRKMSSAGFSAVAAVSNKFIELSSLEVALDGAQLEGSLRREMIEGGKPKLSAALAGDKADFDQLTALFRLFAGDSQQGKVASHDISAKLDVEELAVSDFVARDVSGSLDVSGGRLKIENLSIGNLDGAHITARAELAGFPDRLKGSANGTFAAANPLPLLQKLSKATGQFQVQQRFIDNPELLSDAEITFNLTPDAMRTLLVAEGRAGSTEIDLRFVTDGLTRKITAQEIDSTIVLVNANASQLMAQLGIPVLQRDIGGRSAFRGVVKGVPADGADVQAALTLASGYASAAGILTDKFQGSLKFRAEVDDLDPIILLSGLAVPGFGQGLAGELSGTVEFDKPHVRLKNFEGRLGESTYSGELELNHAAAPRPLLNGRVKTDHASLETLSGTVFSAATQRNARLFSGLDADLTVSADRMELPTAISVRTGDLELVEVRLLILDGDMVFEDINARLAGGRLTGRTSVGQTSAARTIGGQLTLVGGDASKVAALFSQASWLTGDVSISGNFESAGEDGSALISGLTGSGTVSIKNGTIIGLNETALGPILRAADKIADEQVARKTPEIVGPEVQDGAFAFGEAQAAYSITSGVMRAGNVHLESNHATVKADMSLDLASRSIEADTTVAYRPGRESVVAATPTFSMKIVGLPENQTVRIDTSLFSTYLGLRLSERKQREFEAQKAAILERQRLLRTARLYSLKDEQRRLAQEEQERIRKLRVEEEERRRLEQIRRAREALEQAKIEAELKAAELQANTEAAAEAGRRANRKDKIELLRQRAQKEADHRKNASDTELLDFNKLPGG